MNLKPLSDNVIIEPTPRQEKTESGVFIPNSVVDKETPEHGTVVAVGPGRATAHGKVLPMEIKVGDKVLFSKYGPSEIEVEKKIYLIARQEDILAVVK